MDFIRPIGPAERDIDPLRRVERAHDDGPPKDRDQSPDRRPPRDADDPAAAAEATTEGPVEGEDGHLHIDIRA